MVDACHLSFDCARMISDRSQSWCLFSMSEIEAGVSSLKAVRAIFIQTLVPERKRKSCIVDKWACSLG